jgi:dTDP-glucose 4,6-dehydratase
MESGVRTPVNVGNGDERTIRELADVVLDVTDSDSGVTYEERPPDDPEVRRPDLTKAKRELDWEPTVSLEEGIERTVDYFESRV